MLTLKPWQLALLLVILMILGGGIGAALWSVSRGGVEPAPKRRGRRAAEARHR
ncbi:hypothetical protein HC031_07770 [Planosporangium thailandense]|uniref:Uncharacterized protein n=1 Tax=Planosporangium thailandense TaxID=765197 RepID=A0ABX0XUC8_9ACTN|nr:hypothetical protein [Planosporangium thailandense]NJC69617.1 hypothetical protein [Planosporangium thailandense]